MNQKPGMFSSLGWCLFCLVSLAIFLGTLTLIAFIIYKNGWM